MLFFLTGKAASVTNGATTYTDAWGQSGSSRLLLAQPMSRQNVLRGMVLGFTLVVLLVLLAAYVGYEGSQSIQTNAQMLVREHLVHTGRGALLDAEIESQSRELLQRLTWILGACLLLAVGGSGLTIWTTIRAFRRLEWQAEELGRVSWHLVDSNEQIARRFSHEMHDELGQALTGMKGIVRRMNGADLEPSREELLALLDEVISGVRELSQLLRPVILDDFGLDASLRWLTERFSQRTQIEVIYESNFNGRLADQIETQMFRITQEALTNVARHSRATKAWVRLHVNGTRIRLAVEDNGRGLVQDGKKAGPSLGMVGMRARVRQIDGEFKLENRHEGGLRILAEAPVLGRGENDQAQDANPAG